MHTRIRTFLHVFVATQFLVAAMGVPLYQHLCAVTGLHAPLSSCAMHSDPPAEDGCCSDHMDTIPDAVSWSESESGPCCTDIDVSPVVKDAYTIDPNRLAPDAQAFDWTAIASVSCTMMPQPVPSGLRFFCDSSPPARGDTRILYSSLLI